MASKRTLVTGASLLVLTGVVLGASKFRPVQNFYYALQIERTLDRYAQTDTTKTGVVATIDASGREASLVSAFFGLDGGLPSIVSDWAVCKGAGGADGMPVIFSHEVDVNTLDPGDFKVVQRSGAIGKVTCLTLAPADDPGELRTALLAGQFGSPGDPAISVEVTGDILSLDGAITFKGTQVDVVPLEDGPSIVFAETVPSDQWELGKVATQIPFGGGSGCPDGTKQIVRATWNGGITKPGGAPVDGDEGALYQITIELSDRTEQTTSPIALADTGDGDNNHKLCLDTDATVKSVAFPAGHVTDPRKDLNPATSIALAR
ncbi:MAG: hypothetical protein AAFR64_02260 [Pseudomonadota bacterium]